jgi:hypothetical protein
VYTHFVTVSPGSHVSEILTMTTFIFAPSSSTRLGGLPFRFVARFSAAALLLVPQGE